jgi:hypothetical protein
MSTSAHLGDVGVTLHYGRWIRSDSSSESASRVTDAVLAHRYLATSAPVYPTLTPFTGTLHPPQEGLTVSWVRNTFVPSIPNASSRGKRDTPGGTQSRLSWHGLNLTHPLFHVNAI